MGEDIVDTELEDVLESLALRRAGDVRDVADLIHLRPAARLIADRRLARRAPREVVELEVRVLLVPVHHRLEHVSLKLFPHVEQPDAAHPHQPLVGRSRAEVDPHGPHVHGNTAGRLDDVGIYVGAVGVRDLADGLGVVEEPVDVRNEGQRDELGVVVDRPLVLLWGDLPVLLP